MENNTGETQMEPRLKSKYKGEVIAQMMKEFGYKNSLQAPKLLKVVLNMGVGKDSKDPKAVESAEKELSVISGQKTIIRRAKKVA